MIVALIGLADSYLNRDHPWRRVLTEAVFPFYLIHQTIIVGVEGWLLHFGLPRAAEFAILLVATLGGCWIFYAVGREIGWLRPLIGLRPRARKEGMR
jgi:glucans biosynthesis protein C